MNIQHEQKGDDGSFYITTDGDRSGELVYTMTGPKEMNIYHTEVVEELRGKNAGKQLVEAAVNYARKNQLKIAPSCSYAKTIFAREQDYRDVLA
jgi:predicted GNAT family acetyltransferase